MEATSDLRHVLDVLVALVNSGPGASETELLGDIVALTRFIESWAITDIEPPATADLKELHDLRRRFRTVFVAPNDEAKIAIVNELLAAASIQPRLANHYDLRLHVHYFTPHARLADHLHADFAMGLAQLLVLGGGSRLRVCAAPDCARVYVDLSRNRTRLYCDSRRCGNRLHAAAYRARQRS